MANPRIDQTSTATRQWHRLMVLPLLLLFALFTLVYGTGLDQEIAAKLFAWQGQQWLLKDAWWTETLLHQGARQLNQWLVLCLLCVWLYQMCRGRRTSQLRALGVFLLSLILCFSTIALLKKLIPMECPWDLQSFGGSAPFIGIFSFRPPDMLPRQCFPAGHASIGYSWLGMFFFLRLVKPRFARPALWCSIGLGLVLGFVQQLRGAHFLSHDIATAAICWLITCSCFRHFYSIQALGVEPSTRHVDRDPPTQCNAAVAVRPIQSAQESIDV